MSGDRRAERHHADGEAQAQRFGRQIAGGGAEREGEEDRGPVENVAPRRDDRVDGERPLDPVPDSESRGHSAAKTFVLV